MLEIIDVDFNDPAHARAVVGLLDEYARGDMGSGEPLPEAARRDLPSALAARPWAHALLARVDGEPAGLAVYFEGFSTFACKPLLNLHDFMVSERYRGLGIAQALLWALEQAALRLGCCKLTLEVLEGNLPARALYRKMGYEAYTLQDGNGRAEFWQKKLAA
ncbi:GNAT family N-acetyltransferase [Bordetella genomosp. 13]|uniref:GNAT family N-acetyltransferase n=1 Tax=Bordetella genomosp. 13 TaxID=463040 RepID=A0A1W6ZDK5_9BORD|nr:GNAT family N-acetyltransferase [Bordetella genomosp. 13]ARP95345.1 GNAT family N-acetyltransferase [Bordetella genomosp. 13]